MRQDKIVNDLISDLTFDDVLIKPRYSLLNSRKEVYLGTMVGSLTLQLPILSANMDTVTGPEMAIALNNSLLGGLGVLHRFSTVEENVRAYYLVVDKGADTGVSIGISDNELIRAKALYRAGARLFILDVAHGAQEQVAQQYKRLMDIGPDITPIVGNFATHESVGDFILGQSSNGKSLGNGCGFKHIDDFVGYIKVGIGPGSACTTRIKTGCGVPQLSAILDVKKLNVKVVADGGMKTPGDIAKAIAAGADLVMLGGMLAGTEETPGEISYITTKHGPLGQPLDAIKVKKYRGSASKESYEVQEKDTSYITAEGEAFTVPYKGKVETVLRDIDGGLRSAFTYVGAKNIPHFQERAQFVRISNSTLKENGPHGKAT